MPQLFPKPSLEAKPFGSFNSPPSGRYELGGSPVPSVTEILRDVGLGMDARTVPEDLLANKSRIGTIVHEEIRRTLTEGDGTRLYEERVMGYLWSWREWYKRVEPFDIVACERSVIPSPLVAGTMDLLVRRKKDGRWILYDWKSRDPKWYDGFQLAGYLGLAALDPTIPYHWIDLPNTDRIIVSLREWDTARERQFDDPEDFEIFNAACRLWHARTRKR
jgi:hypothetical protein